MSDKPKFPRAEAMRVAAEVCTVFKPLCEKLIVAGSLRRGRALVGDVEILFVPKVESVRDGLFDDGVTCHCPVEELLAKWLEQGRITKRLNIRGHELWGPKNKTAVHVASGIPVDFFTTSVPNWWVSLVIRTGGKETNLKLTTGAQKLGRTLNAYGCGVTYSDGMIIPATSEQHVFELCGVPYAEPEQRA